MNSTPRYPRANKRPTNEYKALLRLHSEYSTTGLYYISEPHDSCYKGRSVDSFDELNIPSELQERFRYWLAWTDLHHPMTPMRDGPDFHLCHSYAIGLATDLKRFLGSDYYIEYAGIEIHDDYEYLTTIGYKKQKNA